MRYRRSLVALSMALMLGLSLALSACGGGSSSTTAGSTTASETKTSAKPVSSQAVSEAEAVLKPYIGHPSPFPVTQKLKEIPRGSKVIYVNCGAAYCSLIYQLLQPAAKMLGLELSEIKAGSAANTVSAAFDSVVAQKPDAVVVLSENLELWSRQLKELQEAGTVIVTSGITGAEDVGIEAPQTTEKNNALVSKLLASYVMTEMNPEANVVVYRPPELPFAVEITQIFSEELERICPACSVRTTDIPVAEDGSTAPNTIVSDLQANPETTLAVFPSGETEFGLPAALETAGIEIETLGFGPGPTNLQYIKEGKETVALGVDTPVLAWTLADLVARQLVGQKAVGLEAEGISVYQFLKKEDLPPDVSQGWTGYPDFAERFAKLWGVEG